MRQPRADGVLGVDAGEVLHRPVPADDLAVAAQGNHAHGQLQQGLAMEAAQAVQLCGQAGEAVAVLLQARFDELDVLAGFAVLGLVGQVVVHQLMGHGRPQQAGQVGLQLVTQAPQCIGPCFVGIQLQVAEGHVHFPGGGAGPQRPAQRGDELVHGLRAEIPAVGAAQAVHRAGFGGGALRPGHGRDDGDDRVHHAVEGHRHDRHLVPVVGAFGPAQAEHFHQVLGVPVRVHHGQQQRRQPHCEAGAQPRVQAVAVAGRPEQGADQAGHELQRGHERQHAQFHRRMIGPGQAVEHIGQGENRGDQHAPGPEQIPVQVLGGIERAGGQDQVVQAHARQRQDGDDQHAAGAGQSGQIPQHGAAATVGQAHTQSEVVR